MKPHFLVTCVVAGTIVCPAQDTTYVVSQPAQTSQPNTAPIYRITVTSRSIKAINFHHRQGSTDLDLVGTALMPEGKGKVRVDSKTGATKVEANVEKMKPAEQIGSEFLTYVLWAITPEGRPQNLGEVFIDNGGRAKIAAASDLQTFGLIVTAEPYYAVTQPSSAVVLESAIDEKTAGTIMPIQAKYELLERAFYEAQANTEGFRSARDKRTPLDLREARLASAIASSVGADHYAADTMEKARVDLKNAEDLAASKGDTKKIQTLARHSAQLFEDARLISVRKQKAQEEELTRAREVAARHQADAESAARVAAEQAKVQAEAAAETARQDEAQARARAAHIRAQAERDQARLTAEAEEAKRQRAQLREQLRRQFNMILETRETARGLILNVSDVLFEFGKADLKPEAREKLAKVSGILLGHPDLQIAAEGHTDSVGSDEFNQRLSEKRAEAVATYLVSQGVPRGHVDAKGFGKTQPIASNDAGSGRQQNRRVELVVSGDVISSGAGPSSDDR